MSSEDGTIDLRPGQAAEMLGVSIETLRRWEAEGRLAVRRSRGGQRLVPLVEVSRLLAERRRAGVERRRAGATLRRAGVERPIVAQSARNRFDGIVTRIEKDRVAAVVEVQAGPHRLVSLMTAEAVDDLGLRVGDDAVCVIKATNVIVEVPSGREPRS
jgi:molybdopterin-binding protein